MQSFTYDVPHVQTRVLIIIRLEFVDILKTIIYIETFRYVSIICYNKSLTFGSQTSCAISPLLSDMFLSAPEVSNSNTTSLCPQEAAA